MDGTESLRSKFKKVDNGCWLAQSVDLSNRDELYYQPFNGCAVFVRPDYLPSNNLAEVSISLRPLDEDESYRGPGIYRELARKMPPFKVAYELRQLFLIFDVCFCCFL